MTAPKPSAGAREIGREARHTPGPWTAREGRNDTFVIEAPGSSPGLIAQVATVYETTVHVDQPERRESDARLIASAPELLEALKRIVFEPQGVASASHADVLRAVENIARAAIAKAEARP